MPRECPDFPEFIFSISDYLIYSNPKLAESLVRQMSSALANIAGMFDLALLSAFLLTYVENIAFYFYCIYIPYRIVVKGIQIAVWTLFYGAIIFLIVAFMLNKWEMSLDDLE